MNTEQHLTLVTTRRTSTRRPMPRSFLGRPADVYRARYATSAAPELPLAA